jgi:hypothetical protein
MHSARIIVVLALALLCAVAACNLYFGTDRTPVGGPPGPGPGTVDGNNGTGWPPPDAAHVPPPDAGSCGSGHPDAGGYPDAQIIDVDAGTGGGSGGYPDAGCC